MADKLCSIFVLLISSTIVTTMYIPEDTEIFDDYNTDPSLDGSSDDAYLELRSLNGYAIRDKRNSPYFVRESPGLRSHFSMNQELLASNTMASLTESLRHVRSVDKEQHTADNAVKQVSDTIQDALTSEALPVAEKQVMDRDDRNIGTMATDKWTKAPFEYSSKLRDSMDSAVAASTNEGIKSRTPLVNFVTQQQRKSADQSIDQNPSEARSEVYSDQFYVRPRSSTAPMSANYRAYDDTYSRRYDGYDRDVMRSYQPVDYGSALDYMPRRPTYHDDYYYDYPFSQGNVRYNVPDRRDHRQLLHTNEIYEVPPVRPMRNRRIIYYATLPDIVRSPPRVDLKYRPLNGRYDSNNNNQRYNNNNGYNQNVAPPYYPSSISAPLAYTSGSNKDAVSKRS